MIKSKFFISGKTYDIMNNLTVVFAAIMIVSLVTIGLVTTVHADTKKTADSKFQMGKPANKYTPGKPIAPIKFK
jgi:preprotein translocase subunit SecG